MSETASNTDAETVPLMTPDDSAQTETDVSIQTDATAGPDSETIGENARMLQEERRGFTELQKAATERMGTCGQDELALDGGHFSSFRDNIAQRAYASANTRKQSAPNISNSKFSGHRAYSDDLILPLSLSHLGPKEKCICSKQRHDSHIEGHSPSREDSEHHGYVHPWRVAGGIQGLSKPSGYAKISKSEQAFYDYHKHGDTHVDSNSCTNCLEQFSLEPLSVDSQTQSDRTFARSKSCNDKHGRDLHPFSCEHAVRKSSGASRNSARSDHVTAPSHHEPLTVKPEGQSRRKGAYEQSTHGPSLMTSHCVRHGDIDDSLCRVDPGEHRLASVVCRVDSCGSRVDSIACRLDPPVVVLDSLGYRHDPSVSAVLETALCRLDSLNNTRGDMPTSSHPPPPPPPPVAVVMYEDSPIGPSTVPGFSSGLASRASLASAFIDVCRICHCEAELPESPLISPCLCSGSLKWVHQACLQQWVKSSDTKSCELCKFDFEMTTKFKPFRKWTRLDMSTAERRKVMCSVTFHVIAVTCVIWSLCVLIDRTTEEWRDNKLDWSFWTKLIVVAIGFTGGLVFMYVQCKMYVQLCRRWRAYNRVIYIQNVPDKKVRPPASDQDPQPVSSLKTDV